MAPGTSTGRPARSKRHPSDVPVVLTRLVGGPPDDVVDLLAGDAFRATSSAMTWAARSSGRTEASAPPNRPMGVRTASTM